MRWSRRNQLAVNSMLDVALCEQSGPVALRAIANRHHVSPACLEHVFARLRTAGLVESTRGPGGGYSLGRQAGAISVADIVAAVEKDESGRDERDSRPGLASDLWQQLEVVMQTHMVGITLADLLVGPRAAEPPRAPKFRGSALQLKPAAPTRTPLRGERPEL